MVDAAVSKAVAREGVPVRVRGGAPTTRLWRNGRRGALKTLWKRAGSTPVRRTDRKGNDQMNGRIQLLQPTFLVL